MVDIWNNSARVGVYADNPNWGEDVKKIYEQLTYDGAAEDYSKTIEDVDKDKIENLKGEVEIPDYDFSIIRSSSNGESEGTLSVSAY